MGKNRLRRRRCRMCELEIGRSEGKGTMRSIENFELQFRLIADKV
jgi:hypothetical protein